MNNIIEIIILIIVMDIIIIIIINKKIIINNMSYKEIYMIINQIMNGVGMMMNGQID